LGIPFVALTFESIEESSRKKASWDVEREKRFRAFFSTERKEGPVKKGNQSTKQSMESNWAVV
jgi:hypothetical protein